MAEESMMQKNKSDNKRTKKMNKKKKSMSSNCYECKVIMK